MVFCFIIRFLCKSARGFAYGFYGKGEIYTRCLWIECFYFKRLFAFGLVFDFGLSVYAL